MPVSVPIADVYSGLERGSIDCTLSDATNLDKGSKFWEVAKTVNTLPQGVVVGATYVFNKDAWAGLEPAQRRVLLDNVATGLARSQVAYHVGVEAALKGSRERGLKVTEPTQEMKDTLAAFQTQVAENLPAKSMAERGIEDPTDVADGQRLRSQRHPRQRRRPRPDRDAPDRRAHPHRGLAPPCHDRRRAPAPPRSNGAGRGSPPAKRKGGPRWPRWRGSRSRTSAGFAGTR